MDSIITRQPPASVTYDLSHPAQTIITLPAGSTWSSGLHFHRSHDEYLVVHRGSVRVRLDSRVETVNVRPGDAPIEIAVPRGVWHDWGRATTSHATSDCDLAQEDVVVIERTDPADGEKTVFFWNLNTVILQQTPWWFPARRMWDWWVTFRLFVIFAELDNVPVMLDVPALVAGTWLQGAICRLLGEACVERWVRGMDESWSLLVLWVAQLIGHTLGLGAVGRKFTPLEAYQESVATGKKGKKEM
ncbi:hypothetical protein F5B22DRAFT_594697 [Xylaria bambusicola]|uniref:uncharacterized protein n=1 Tax=Xylaria bambusicola TaxID=326684 RepID=UPI0020084496|nr:uncharacterized protein F5B22DRAFT_594697 [Xylaria bambusicola]KAI0521920.1 hypothetical protein F5B22DRAFT_594697 [Xylaria bambusicola]